MRSSIIYFKKVKQTSKIEPPALGSLLSVLGMEVKREERITCLFLKICPTTTTSIKMSRRELFIGIVIHEGIF